jgi:hypothetical protein
VIKVAIPLLHVSNAIAALQFYCTKLGFRPEFAQDSDGSGSLTGPSYMGFSRDGVWIHLSSFPDDGVAGGVANLVLAADQEPRVSDRTMVGPLAGTTVRLEQLQLAKDAVTRT